MLTKHHTSCLRRTKERTAYSDEGLTLETSATHQIPQAENIPHQLTFVDQTRINLVLFLFIYAPNLQLAYSHWEKDWSLVSHSVKV